MRDPHVVSLRYRLVPSEGVTFKNPPPLEHEAEAFRLRLADDILMVEMKEHRASAEEAQRLVKPFLRAWEIDLALRQDRNEVTFVFDGAEVVDRNPDPLSTTQTIHADATFAARASFAASAHVTKPQYPGPPSGFAVSPDVETMWARYEGYRAGREPLASMAFMCLRVLEASAGGRDEAASRYDIDRKVMSKLGFLTSEVGDARTARKMPGPSGFRAHTNVEIAWIEAVIKALIRRAGETAFDPKTVRRKIIMSDFPTLPAGPP